MSFSEKEIKKDLLKLSNDLINHNFVLLFDMIYNNSILFILYVKDVDKFLLLHVRDNNNLYKKRINIFIINMNEYFETCNRILKYKIWKTEKLESEMLYLFGYDFKNFLFKMAYVESNNDLPIDRYYLLKDLGGYYFIKYNKKNFEKLYNTSKEILSNIKKMTSDEKIKLKGYTSLAHIEYTKKPDEIFFKSYKEIGVSEEDDDADQYYFCSIWSPHIIVKNFQLSLNIKCIEYELNDKKLLIDNRSCIFIGPYKTPLIKHQNEAIDIINTFLSLANVFDVNARSVSVNEYMALKCKNVYNNLRGFGFFSNLSSRRSALIPLVSRGEPYIIYDRSTKKEVQIVNSKVFDKIYSYMNKTLSNSDMKISLWLFLEGYNSYLNADYKSSYLSCWTVLEKFIESDWNAYILTIKTNKERRRKLKNSMLWTIDYKIETLNMAKIYDDSLYSELMRYKRFRNRIIHDGVKCPKSNSEKIILKCKSFLIEKFNLK